jgi:tetratricopeptide (TPR) repeat protein
MDREEALRLTNKELTERHNRRKEDFLNSYGILLDIAGQYEDAISIYKSAIEYYAQDKEDSVIFIFNWAAALANSGNDLEAIEKLKEVTRMDVGFSPARVNLGLSYIEVGDTSRGVDMLMKISKTKLPYENLYLIISDRLFNLGKYDNAREVYEKWNNFYEMPDIGYYNWAKTLEKMGIIDEAIDKYQMAKILDSGNLNKDEIANKIKQLKEKLRATN